MTLIKSLVLISFVALLACFARPIPKPPISEPVPTPTPEVVKVIYKADWDGKAKGPEYTQALEDALDANGAALLNMADIKDADVYCPKFSKLLPEQRKQLFFTLISTMSKFESGHDTNQTYTESFADSSGKKVVSRGLLQISQESANQSKYKCGIAKPQDLHVPYTNLACGVKILSAWIVQDGYIGSKVDGGWKGGARYWSVLRIGKEPQKKISAATKSLSFCR